MPYIEGCLAMVRLAMNRWTMLVVMFLLTTGASTAFYAIAPLAPFLIMDFGLNKGEVGLLSSAAAFGGMSSGIASGFLVDRVGIRRVIVLGALFLTGGCLGLSTITSLHMALPWVLIMGIGFSTTVPATNRTIYEWFPRIEHAFAIGLKQSGTPLGVAIGAVLLTIISLKFGWRGALFISAAIVVTVSIISFKAYRTPPGEIKNNQGPFKNKLSLNRSMIRQIAGYGFMGASFAGWQISIITFLAIYLNEVHEMPLQISGSFLAIAQLSGAIARPIVGGLCDKLFHEKRRNALIILGTINATIAIALFFVDKIDNLLIMVPLIIIIGGFSMGWFGPLFAGMIEVFGKESAGTASGVAFSLNLAGSAIGAPLFGYIVDINSSFKPAFIFMGVYLLIATIIFGLLSLGAPIRHAQAKSNI